MVEETAVVKPSPQEPEQNRAAEPIVDRPVPQIRKKNGEMIQPIPQERTSDRIGEQTVDVPAQIQVPIVDVVAPHPIR